MNYKVGDKVKIVSLQSVGRGFCQDVVGDVGEITDYDSSHILKYKVKIEGGGRWWWEESNLELIEDTKPNTSEVIETTKGETEMNVTKVETTTPKFKKGDKVTSVDNYELGVFEVLAYSSGGYCCYQKGFQGHSGNFSLGAETFVGTVYEAQCCWFLESELEIAEVSKNYRNMKPTDLIKVNIDGFEGEIPLGDLIHTQALISNSTGRFGYKLYTLLKAIDEKGICRDAYSTIKVSDQQGKLMEDFFIIEAQKEADKVNLKELISNKQNELKELQDKLNQLEN